MGANSIKSRNADTVDGYHANATPTAGNIPVLDTNAQISLLTININDVIDGRLTLESGVPISSTDQTAKTTVYFTPYIGNKISLYDGSIWKVLSFTEKSVAVPATTNTPFDIFAYINNSAVTLETVNWTNDTTRATTLVYQDGVLSKNGDTTRRYLGTGRTTGTSGQCEDSGGALSTSTNRRFIWNHYNQVQRNLQSSNSNTSWSYSTAAWRESNNGSGQVRAEFVIGQLKNNFVTIGTYFNPSPASGGFCYQCASLDSVNGSAGYCCIYKTAAALMACQGGDVISLSAVGYHYITTIEYGSVQGVTFAGSMSGNARMFVFG